MGSERSQFVPQGLRVMAERLAAFHRNRFRIENAGANSAQPGQTITVTLPSNTLVDLHSFKMHARLQTAGTYFAAPVFTTTGSQGDNSLVGKHDKTQPPISYRVVAPEDPHQLIDRMTISMNGTAVQQGCLDYATVHKVKSLLDKPLMKRNTVDNSIGLAGAGPPEKSKSEEDEFVRPLDADNVKVETADLGDLLQADTTVASETVEGKYSITKAGGSQQNPLNTLIDRTSPAADAVAANTNTCADVILYDWRGFLKESSVRYLPTDLVGAVQIQLTLAPLSRLVTVGSDKNGSMWEDEMKAYEQDKWDQRPNYSFEHIYWTIDTISVDQTYGDMLRGKMAQFGFISLIFKEYYTFQKSGWDANSTDNHRFSLSTGSLDKLYTVMRTDLSLTGMPRPIFSSVPGGDAHVNSMITWTPWLRFIAPYIGAKWNYGPMGVSVPRPGWHFDNDWSMQYNYKINSVMHPQYQATARDAIWDMAYSHDFVDGHHAGTQITSRQVWADSAAIFPSCQNLTDGPLQLMSGYDSRGHSSFIEFNISGLHPTNYYKMKLNAAGTAYDEAEPAITNLTTTSVLETSSELRVGQGLSLAVSR